MRYPERFLTDDETIVAELHPHWRTLLVVGVWTILAVAGIGIALATDLEGTALGVTVLVIVLVWGVLSVPPIINRKFVVYALTTERIIVRTGIISKSSIEIPLESIHDVRFEQNVVERLLRYGDVLLESAGEKGQSLLTDVPDPEGFQSMVYKAREERVLQLEGGGPRDTAAQLKDLAALRDGGDLTQEQFEEQKRRLLGE
ncbi:MAG: PH domain-containing protein [Nitriliruptorales bacterium]|nr:PH domain-containing protein [Nitriliruptorales bacterium]